MTRRRRTTKSPLIPTFFLGGLTATIPNPIENNDGRSTAAVLGDLVDNMKIMQKGLNYMIRTSATQERFNTEIVNRLKHHSEILEQLHDRSITPTAVTNNIEISRRRRQLTVDQSYSVTETHHPQLLSIRRHLNSVHRKYQEHI